MTRPGQRQNQNKSTWQNKQKQMDDKKQVQTELPYWEPQKGQFVTPGIWFGLNLKISRKQLSLIMTTD